MAASHATAKTRGNESHSSARPESKSSSSKRHCANRAEWRIQPGRPAEHLSPHYRLDCEYGSSLVQSWKNEGYEPIYVCGEHANQFNLATDSPAPDRKAPAKPAEPRENAVLVESPKAVVAPQVVAPQPAPPVSPKPSPSVAASPKPSSAPPAIQPRPVRPAKPSGERRASINRLIGELTTELEDNLAQSETLISAIETVDAPLEQALQEIIASGSLSDAQKDAATQQLGALQEFLKQSTSVEIAALKAYRLCQTVQGYLRSDINIVAGAKPGYRAVCESLQAAIYSAAPKTKHLEERLANMLSMKAELENGR
jgi:hypothetical protein